MSTVFTKKVSWTFALICLMSCDANVQTSDGDEPTDEAAEDVGEEPKTSGNPTSSSGGMTSSGGSAASGGSASVAGAGGATGGSGCLESDTSCPCADGTWDDDDAPETPCRPAPEITLASISSEGVQGDTSSYTPSLSADGLRVAFMSRATTLVAGDENGAADIFVHYKLTGETRRISVSPDGTEGNADSTYPSISPDGRYVAFESEASNLVDGDTNGESDVFLHDLKTSTTTIVSVGGTNTLGNGASHTPSVSSNGRYVAFASSASNFSEGDGSGSDIFVRDTETQVTTRVSLPNEGPVSDGGCHDPQITPDGKVVAFWATSPDLVAGDDNYSWDVFVRDLEAETTELVSVATDGTQGDRVAWQPDISDDGRYVTFGSSSPELVPGDENEDMDVFVRDRQTGTTTRVSVASDGTEADGPSENPVISGNGRFIAFESIALLVGWEDTLTERIFVHDLQTKTTRLVSFSSEATPNDPHRDHLNAVFASISFDGTTVAFEASSDDYVIGDTLSTTDVFIAVLP